MTDQGGTADGATGEWTLRRVRTTWRVDRWSIEYLRSGMAASAGNYETDDSSDPLYNAQMRRCVAERMRTMDEPAFVAGTYQIFRGTPKGK